MMMTVLERLLTLDHEWWEQRIAYYKKRNYELKVPLENTPSTLHQFNIEINALYTEAEYDYAEARRNKDAIERLIESILKDFYPGPNEQARRAGGWQYARKFPTQGIGSEETVNLFDIEDKINGYYESMKSTIQIIKEKSNAKITNNSLILIENSLTPQ